jgi:zona occludens toxin
MISLITGLPGNGKTLFALWWIKQKAEKEQREVYYHNIKDLTLPWHAFEAEKWMDLPEGSIIVMDECQFVFAKKPNGSKLPEYYEQLATHRHRGFDIYLITQHPTLIDNFVRQLVGQHYHAVRKFGMARNTIYEWSAANPAPQNPSSQKSAVPMKWPFPKEVYGYYKSAEVHTVKRAIPVKVFLAAGFVVAVLAGGYWALNRYQHRNEKPVAEVATAGAAYTDASVDGARTVSTGARGVDFDPVADAKHYIEKQTPRVAGLAYTAPKYDEITQPVRAPIPAACVQVGTPQSEKGVSCKCYSQQGTPLDVPFNMCLGFARNGWFQDFNADKDRQDSMRTAQSVKVMEGHNTVDSVKAGSQVIVMEVPKPDPPYRPAVGSGSAAPN